MEAKKQYQERQKDIQKEVSLLENKLKKHQNDFDAHGKYWSSVGDLCHVLELLKEINVFLQ